MLLAIDQLYTATVYRCMQLYDRLLLGIQTTQAENICAQIQESNNALSELIWTQWVVRDNDPSSALCCQSFNSLSSENISPSDPWLRSTNKFKVSITSCDICSLTIVVVRNHVKLGVSLRVPYCVVDDGYGLGRSLEDCRPALPKGWKYQMVKTQTESPVRRPVVWTNQWQIWVFFSFEFLRGTANFATQAFGDSLKLSSTGLATQWLIRRSEFIASYKKYFY